MKRKFKTAIYSLISYMQAVYFCRNHPTIPLGPPKSSPHTTANFLPSFLILYSSETNQYGIYTHGSEAIQWSMVVISRAICLTKTKSILSPPSRRQQSVPSQGWEFVSHFKLLVERLTALILCRQTQFYFIFPPFFPRQLQFQFHIHGILCGYINYSNHK